MQDTGLDVGALAHSLLTESVLWTHPDCPFKGSLTLGHPQVLLIAGDNGEGKSVFVEGLRAWAKQEVHAKSIQLSMRERTGAGTPGQAEFRRTSMYGFEQMQSTGSASLSATQLAFHNLNTWSEDGTKVLLVLDEPELGLARSFAGPMGTFIARSLLALQRAHVAVALVTHDRNLANGLTQELQCPPSFLHLGQDALDLPQWLAKTEQRTVEDLLALPNLCLQRTDALQALFSSL